MGLTYRTGDVEVPALQEVSLTVAVGTMAAVTGQSGSGKSSLLTVLGGLQRPDQGTVSIAGEEITSLSESHLYRHRRQSIGYLFQAYNLIDVLTAVENVALPLQLNRMGARSARRAARAALASVGVKELEDRYPSSMSGGQQQRVALARATCGGRRLILADEPTGALDSASAEQVLDVLAALVADGSTCVVVTHNEAVAQRASRRFVMRDGHLSETGTASERAGA